MEHSKEYIDNFLRKCFFATLSYEYDGGILSQLMIFGHTMEGVFFLVSECEKELFKPICENKSSQVSIMIYKEEEYLESIGQVNIIGKATLLDKTIKDAYETAYEVVGKKSPLIKNFAFGEKVNHTIIKVEADTISYISFKDIREKCVPTVLKRS